MAGAEQGDEVTMPRWSLLAAVAAVLLGCQADRVPPHEEPPDTTQPPAPAAVSLTGLPDSMTVGDTAAVTGALVDSAGAELETGPSAWNVKLTGVRYVSNTGLTNVVRAAAAGAGAVRYTHVASGLVAEVTTQISELPDTTAGQVGEEPRDTVIEVPGPIGDWPDNEPAGMTALTHVGGSSIDWPGWSKFSEDKWTDTARVRIVVDPDSKYGHAIEKRFKIGDASGWGDPVPHRGFSGAGQTFPRQLHKEVYVRFVWQYSPNWDDHAGGNKLWLGNDGNHVATSAYTGCAGVPYTVVRANGFTPWQIHAVPIVPSAPTQTSVLGRCQGASAGVYPRVTRGEYHTVEVWKRMNDPGQANGALRFWFDGIEYTRFNGMGVGAELNFGAGMSWRSLNSTDPRGISTRVEAPLYWGGSGDVKKANDWIRVSEIYLSVRN